MEFVSTFAKGQGYPQKRIQEIGLATEEALVNIFNYAYPDDPKGEVEVRCKMEDDNNLFIDLLDTGIPFKFDSISAPDLDATITSRLVGGLGVFLIKKMANDVQYRREGEMNILTMLFHKTG